MKDKFINCGAFDGLADVMQELSRRLNDMLKEENYEDVIYGKSTSRDAAAFYLGSLHLANMLYKNLEYVNKEGINIIAYNPSFEKAKEMYRNYLKETNQDENEDDTHHQITIDELLAELEKISKQLDNVQKGDKKKPKKSEE